MFSSATLESALQSGAAMTPYARRTVFLYMPGSVVHLAPVPSVFDGKIRRRTQVEGEHVIVGMPTDGGDDLKLPILDQVHRRADIVDRTHLHHDVIETLWAGGRY